MPAFGVHSQRTISWMRLFANITQVFNFFLLFFGAFFLAYLQLMEDIKDGKEEVLDEVVMEHIK